MSSNLILPGILLVIAGLIIIVYGVRIARIYAILSALSIAIGLGFAITTFFVTILHMADSIVIPILFAIAIAVVLLYWVAKAYIAYLKIYAILGMIKIIGSVIAMCTVLLHIQGGIIAIIILALLCVLFYLIIQAIVKWNHLFFMIGIITDGALISISGGVMVGGGITGHPSPAILLAIIAVPLLIWSGLYRECWRQKIPFPGIKSW